MIEEVLEVEKPNSYIKQQTWPMVTIEMSHITWLLRSNLGNIHLSSLDIKNPIDATYFQHIIYLGLTIQCRKCRRFGHFAKACQIQKVSQHELANINVSQLPTWNEKVARFGRGLISDHNGGNTLVTQ
jgi:hypothetical protein